MGRKVLAVLVLLVAGAGVAAAVLQDDSPAPWPSRDELREHGFAVWPQDTIEEAMDTCADPESWQLDREETALRFARDVLRYPEPRLDPIYPTSTKARFLINTDGVRGVYLGTVVDVRRYDRCWFVVYAEPREGGLYPTVSFIHRSGQARLVIDPIAQETQVGYGSWERWIDGDARVVLELPSLEPDATGHVISLSRYRRVYDIHASPLRFVPQPATAEIASIGLKELARTRGICRRGDGFRSPRPALADLYSWTFDKPLSMRRSRWIFKGGNQIKPRGGDRWLLKLDGIELDARVPNLKENCWRVTSVSDGDRDLLKSITIAEDSFTFDLRWRDATAAVVTLGSTRGGDSWSLQRFERPITVFGLFSEPLTEPFYVSVVLREGRQVMSAQSSWYQSH